MLSTLPLWCLPRQVAAQQMWAKARVERSMLTGNVDIMAFIDVPADPAVAWAVLTDYNKLAEFVPDMHASRILSKPGEPIQVYQRGRKSWLLVDVPMELVFRMDETPPSSIRFRMLSGNIRGMQGEWQLSPFGQGVRIKYVALMKPGLLSPRAPGDFMLIEADIENMLQAIGKEILRRSKAVVRP